MARIIVTHKTGSVDGVEIIPPFYEGFLKVLSENGNSVLHITTDKLIKRPWNGTNDLKNNIKKEKLHNYIKNFNPDLVISFNNSSIEDMDKIIDCPIILWNADGEYYYNDKEYIKENVSRYHFACSTKYLTKNPKELFGASENKIFVSPFSTALQSENLEKKYNISFIASIFNFNLQAKDLLIKFSENDYLKKYFLDFIKSYEKNIDIPLDDLLNVLKSFGVQKDIDVIKSVYSILSTKRRNDILYALRNEGIKLFGEKNSIGGNFYNDPSLACSNSNNLCYSIKHNQDVYNSSNVCISISHAQAKGSYPWRVPDIMATNGCLVTNNSLAIEEEFVKTVGIPVYSSANEAVEICRDLSINENKRNDIVLASQELINKKYRFEHRFKELEQIFGVNILNLGSKMTIVKLCKKNFIKKSKIRLEKRFIKAAQAFLKG